MDTNQIDILDIEQKIGYSFSDKSLLAAAFVHCSSDRVSNNERLEFLGDSVLNLIAAHKLFNEQELPEGDMARRRAGLVSARPLAAIVDKLDIASHIICGNGDRNKIVTDAVKADLFEAVTAAIYLDGGLERAGEFVLAHLGYCPPEVDYKSALQVFAQKKGLKPQYGVLAQDGTPHAPIFTVAVMLGGQIMGNGTAGKKRDAEQAAARAALSILKATTDL